MTCPYLTEITMVFCQASPVRKLIPSDRISTASKCEADEYRHCPLYREALAHALHAIEQHEHAEPKPAEERERGEPS